MIQTQFKPRQVLDVAAAGKVPGMGESATLVQTDGLRVVRLAVAADRVHDTHKADGEVTVYCARGRITLFVEGEPHALAAGQFMYLQPRTPHAVRGEEDSIVLLTIASPTPPAAPKDAVQEASEDSFPASDPPAL